MITPQEALTRILNELTAGDTDDVPLKEAADRFLAEDLAARVHQPPFAVSAMDGYAVHGRDVAEAPAPLKQIGDVPAGGRFEGAVPSGCCVRIFTGARVPEDLDTVVIQENVAADGDIITVQEAASVGANIRPKGNDFSVGDVLLKKGERLNSRSVALSASMNFDRVRVARKPVVAVLATGDELALPGSDIGENQILSSNSFGLVAQIEAWGGKALDLGIAKDTPEDLLQKALPAKEADFFVTNGGASVGDHDLIQKVLVPQGLNVDFWKIAQKPGKPLIFGRFGDVPMLGLPGNPVSAMVCAQLYLKPALFALQGARDPAGANPLQVAVLSQELSANPSERQDYIRAISSIGPKGELNVTPALTQDSGQLATLAASDCLIVRPPHSEEAPAGEKVPILALT